MYKKIKYVRLMNEMEKKFHNVERFELFTGYKDEKNIYFYNKLGYRIFKEEFLGDKVKLVFFEKKTQNTC